MAEYQIELRPDNILEYDWDAVDKWCVDNIGPRGVDWNREFLGETYQNPTSRLFYFRNMNDVLRFKLTWMNA
jgi:hypothetical protein